MTKRKTVVDAPKIELDFADIENTMEPETEPAAAAAPPPQEKKRRSKKPPAPECAVCCETLNKSLRAGITCTYEDCKYTACKTCVRTYLTSTIQEPHCMNCKKPFDDEFMIKNLNRSYYKGDFKEHRKKILFDVEVSKISDTMAAAENFLAVEDINKENTEIREQISKLNHEIGNLQRKIYENNNRSYDLLNRKRGEKRKFIMPCPNEDCRGFLSSAYKCEICKNHTCPTCLEVIGPEKTMDHTCNPDCVKNAEAIKKDTRPCPSCGSRIYKIDGCFAGDVEILLWSAAAATENSGHCVEPKNLAREIKVGDILVGDDLRPRTVLRTVRGEDALYDIFAAGVATPLYTVSSKHTLVLKVKPAFLKEVETADHLNHSPFVAESDKTKFKYVRATSTVEVLADEYFRERAFFEGRGYFAGFRIAHTGEIELYDITVAATGKCRPYYGWETDENNLFLLGDGTVAHNCDQMFCTECNVAFNWRTGQIDTGAIHNPHFFEWQRRHDPEMDAVAIARRRVDGPAGAAAAGGGGCNLPNNVMTLRREAVHHYTLYEDEFKFKMPSSMLDKKDEYCKKITEIMKKINNFQRLHRTLEHIINHTIPEQRNRITSLEDNTDLRVMYILKRIDIETMSASIYRKSQTKKKLVETYHVFELMSNVGREMVRDLYGSCVYRVKEKKDEKSRILFEKNDGVCEYTNRTAFFQMFIEVVDECYAEAERRDTEIKEFLRYCNEQFKRIGLLYSERVICIILEESQNKYDYFYTRYQKEQRAIATDAAAAREAGDDTSSENS